MGNKTKIEWCDASWNPVTGCFHGCEYCYARKIANRFGLDFFPKLGDPGMEGARKYDSEEEGQDTMLELIRPYKRNGKTQPYPYAFNPTFHRYRLSELQRWKKPKTIFVCSMADLFGDWVPDEWIIEIFKAIWFAPRHKYLFLTKNPKRYAQLSRKGDILMSPNIWVGATVTNNKQLEEVASAYENIPLATRTFLSIEPIQEDISKAIINSRILEIIDGIILGAETGNRKDKIIPKREWIDKICRIATGPYTSIFMKDSLIPIIGEENMRRELPWQST